MLQALSKNLRSGTPTVADGVRYAAVSAIFVGDERAPQLLYIRRAERANDPWSGQIAFPGGKHEPFDRTLLDTAMRETQEEIGLDLQRERCLGWVDEIKATARGVEIGLIVVPFVFWLDALPKVAPSSDEVSEILQADVAHLRSNSARTTFPYTHEGSSLSLPGYDVDGRVVWGMTYRMTTLLLEAMES